MLHLVNKNYWIVPLSMQVCAKIFKVFVVIIDADS